MPSVQDVAAYILERLGETSSMKLQKLVYYAQAWSLVWDEEQLFPESIEAWANGPVCRALYLQHKGRFKLRAGEIPGDPALLSEAQQQTVEGVLAGYGDKSAQWLVDLSHLEAPWKDVWGERPIDSKCCDEISLASMHEYYSGLNASKDT